MANLKLYLSLLERGRGEKRGDYQRVLGQEVGRLENLIQDLLDLSRLESQQGVAEKQELNLWGVGSLFTVGLPAISPERDAKCKT